jgi:hypothetical protein
MVTESSFAETMSYLRECASARPIIIQFVSEETAMLQGLDA